MTAPLQTNTHKTTLLVTDFIQTVQMDHPLDRNLMRWANVHQYDNQGFTALYWAIYHHNIKNLQILIEYGATLEVYKGCNALFYAIDCDNLEVIKYFIEKGIDKNIIQNGYTLKEHANRIHRFTILKYLI